MPDSKVCPRCKGAGFYLTHEGRGYFRDGSFGHNEWADCDHMPDEDEPPHNSVEE